LNPNEAHLSGSMPIYSKFTVLGAGNGGFAVAGYLALLGLDVTLFNRSLERIRGILESREIELTGLIQGTGKIDKITTNLDEAAREADVIMVVVTADAHHEIAKLIAPYLNDNQVIILSPGRTGGVLEFRNTIRMVSCHKNVTIAETDTLVYVCRKSSPTTVEIKGIKDRVLLSSFSSMRTDVLISAIRGIYPQFKKANIMETSLRNLGAIIHPIIALCNISRIIEGEEFEFYIDGVTPQVATYILEMDAERIKVAQALKVSVGSIMQWFEEVYNVKAESLLLAMKTNPSYKGLMAPKGIDRFITEDIPTGLVPLAYFGKALGIKTPTIDKTINWACDVASKNFWDTGRTLEKMGLSERGFKEQVLAIVNAP
jgi:opine dehydrogenase